MPDENVNQEQENQEEENQEMRNPYNLPEEEVEKAKRTVPHGDCVQPIGAWWQPDPSEQGQTFTKSGPYAAPGKPE